MSCLDLSSTLAGEGADPGSYSISSLSYDAVVRYMRALDSHRALGSAHASLVDFHRSRVIGCVWTPHLLPGEVTDPGVTDDCHRHS